MSSIVSAFLMPGSPLPYQRPHNPPWRGLAQAFKKAAESLAAARPDVILVYSTQWFVVLDELWQSRERVHGTHVDHNWYEYGDLPYDFRVDTELALACVAACDDRGLKSKPCDYDGFPIDTGTIVAVQALNSACDIPIVIAASNIYHDWDTTVMLGEIAVQKAAEQGKRAAVVGGGGVSGTIFREEIDIARDRIASPDDDEWNRRILDTLQRGDVDAFLAQRKEYASRARVDMGFKAMAWLLGAMGRRLPRATVHGYGPTYGS